MVCRRTRARGEVPVVVERRPWTVGRGTDSDRKRSSTVPLLRPALSESAGLASLSLLPDGKFPQSLHRRGEAEPTRPGRVGRWQAGLRRTLAFGTDRLATGSRRSSDRRRFRRQSSMRSIRCSEIICEHLRYLRFSCEGGWALCLRVFVFVMWVGPVQSRGRFGCPRGLTIHSRRKTPSPSGTSSKLGGCCFSHGTIP